jgi:uncharacterized protein YciI
MCQLWNTATASRRRRKDCAKSLCSTRFEVNSDVNLMLLHRSALNSFKQRGPELIAAHRQFLQQGDYKGRLLVPSPSIPPAGGILIARADPLDELNEFLADEPYCTAKVIRFSKITGFDPVQNQPIPKDWFGTW